MQKITITVPATTANLGAGFDCLGAALSLYNKFTFSLLESLEPLEPLESLEPLTSIDSAPALKISVQGTEAAGVATDATNLAYQAFSAVYQALGKPIPGVAIELELGIPLARGLGSSATALVGGLMGANYLAGSPLSPTAIQDLAIQLEGHPDNVVPALLGGCRLSATKEDGAWEICDVPWRSEIVPVVVVPDFELSTAAARAVLPNTYSRGDAIFNTAHLAMLLRGLATGNPALLATGLQDRIHQPYRQSLIPGYEVIRQAAIAQGAYGLVISGAGPSLLALTDAAQARAVGEAIAAIWQGLNIQTAIHILSIDSQGALLQSR